MIEAIVIGVGILFFGYAHITDAIAHGPAKRREAHCAKFGCYDDRSIGTQKWMEENGMAERED